MNDDLVEEILARDPVEALAILQKVLTWFRTHEELPANRDNFGSCYRLLDQAREMMEFGRQRPRLT